MKTEEKKWVLPSRRKRHPVTIIRTTRKREGGGKEEEEREEGLEDQGEGDIDQHISSFAQSHGIC